jgi:hypothetical protein
MSDYSDILNRKKTGDKLGDAFSKQADSMRPMNVGQRREQALLRGLGVGLSYDSEREDKLAELEEQYKQVDSFERELKMSVGKSQKIKADNENFFLTNRNDLAIMNTFLANGDFEAVDIMAPALIENYKKITGRNIGNYAYSRDGKIYLDDGTGHAKGQYIAEILQGIIPESEQMNFPELLTYNSKRAVQAKMDEQRLKNEQIRAQIANLNAHGKLYEAQGKEALRKAENPLMSEKQNIIFKSNVENNQQYIKDARKKVITDKILVQTLNETEEMIIEAAKKGQVGSDLLSQGKRLWSKYLTGDNKEMTIADMAKAAYFARVKEAGGANPSTTEFLTALETIPNTDKNLLASLNVLKKDRNIALNNIYRFNNIEKNLRNNDYQGSPDDENIINFNEEEYNNFVNENSLKKTIRVSKKNKNTGKIITMDVPIDDFEKVYNEGFSFKGK